MGKVNTKYVGLVACIVAIIFSIALTIGIFVKADEPGDGIKKINYEDDYYNAKVLDVDNKVVEDIYKTYESGNLELTATNNEISYTVDTENSNSIKAVSSALCMSADKNLKLDEEVLLYLGEKQDCNYNETTGSAKSEFDNKWILVNGKVPIGMYNEKIDDNSGMKEYYTSAYINEDETASNIKILVDSNNAVNVVGKVIDKDVDGNPLEEVQIEELQNGDKICPAYIDYRYSIVNIGNEVLEATEVYNQDTYTYGSDFILTYDALPNDCYLYSMRTNFKDDVSTEAVEEEYGFFTYPKEISLEDNKIVEVKEAKSQDSSLEGYDYMGTFEFLKQVWAHKKANNKDEIYQAYCHKIDGVQKGYISTWNSLGINRALRSDTVNTLDADDQKTIDVLDNMCKKISSNSNILMLRKVSADYLTTVFGIKSKDGEKLSDAMVKAYSDEDKKELEDRLQGIVGKKMVEKGFMSASIIPYVNIIFGRTVEIVIKVPEGSKFYISHNVIESEAIFPTNTELVVESVKYNEKKGKYVIIANLMQNF